MPALSPYNGDPPASAPGTVRLYDSTLRDGEQTPGVAFDVETKLEIARALDRAGVPEIEAGFPPVDDDERRAVARIADEGLDADVIVLSRLRRDDLDLCRRLDVDLAMTFVAASDRHIEGKYGTSRGWVVEQVHDVLDHADDHGIRVSFSTEDATRTDLGFLRELYDAALEHDLARVGITDTLGCARPAAVRRLVEALVPDLDVPLSVHLHDDFGLATANLLAGVAAGAEAGAVTVNGIGERGGNVPLEQAAAALEHLLGVETGIDLSEMRRLSRIVAEASGIDPEPHRPLVGDNAFAHESGIHVAAVLEDPLTYEPLEPEAVGHERRLVLGKHTGTAHVRHLLDAMGIDAAPKAVEAIVHEVKAARRRGPVTEERFRAIVADATGTDPGQGGGGNGGAS